MLPNPFSWFWPTQTPTAQQELNLKAGSLLTREIKNSAGTDQVLYPDITSLEDDLEALKLTSAPIEAETTTRRTPKFVLANRDNPTQYSPLAKARESSNFPTSSPTPDRTARATLAPPFRLAPGVRHPSTKNRPSQFADGHSHDELGYRRVVSSPPSYNHASPSRATPRKVSKCHTTATPKTPKRNAKDAKPSPSPSPSRKLNLPPETLVLHSYQKKDVETILQRENQGLSTLVVYDMGMGKTIIAIDLAMNSRSSETRQPILVVCPEVGLLNQWIGEIARFGEGLTANQFSPNMSQDDIYKFDVILTTYSTLGSQYKALGDKPEEKRPYLPIFNTTFHRVILDEAHCIRGRGTWFKGCLALKKRFGLCLTGTPIQNKLNDTQPILEFMGVVDPLGLADITKFNLHIVDKGAVDSYTARKLSDVLRTCIIYRKKDGSIELPSLTRRRVEITLRKAERDLHKFAKAGQLTKTDFAWLRARQVTNHPFLLTTSLIKNGKDRDLDLSRSVDYDGADVPVDVSPGPVACSNIAVPACSPSKTPTVQSPRRASKAPEGQTFVSCDDVLRPEEDAMGEEDQVDLPEGDDGLDPSRLPDFLVPYRSLFSHKYISTKMKAILDIVKEIPRHDKAIIFCNFRAMMALIKIQLGALGIECEMYHGELNENERTEVLRSFSQNRRKRVLLNSIRAGGVGLNITSANHIILAEPCWNPFVEEQAIGRAYRIGQTKPVTVHKIVTLFSVEDEMIETQDEKYDKAHIVLEPCVLDPVC
ncbi:hypothetical protein HYDPIDRAFT_117026 [Hydnomerulius pinastri MD-312]|uniref:P-loop containing nucleoside triphosphate hydrolase protein n=1 Tax=Hydnomerulius pinastri MD-312 TaxID=994086 RepID=A0A0C9V4Q7_9AGAM|nr:hypothetical protein HYDPIDRAFT_117026 [Hydnomerulius pinastri MD-312]